MRDEGKVVAKTNPDLSKAFDKVCKHQIELLLFRFNATIV